MSIKNNQFMKQENEDKSFYNITDTKLMYKGELKEYFYHDFELVPIFAHNPQTIFEHSILCNTVYKHLKKNKREIINKINEKKIENPKLSKIIMAEYLENIYMRCLNSIKAEYDEKREDMIENFTPKEKEEYIKINNNYMNAVMQESIEKSLEQMNKLEKNNPFSSQRQKNPYKKHGLIFLLNKILGG